MKFKLHIVCELCYTVAGHSANCCVFDVGGPEKCVSIHLPLHRLLAGLNHHLPPDVNYTSSQFAPMVGVVWR